MTISCGECVARKAAKKGRTETQKKYRRTKKKYRRTKKNYRRTRENYRRTKRTGASGKKFEAPPDFAPVARTQRSVGAKAAVLRKRNAVTIRINSNPYRGKVTSSGTATFTSEEGHPKTGRPLLYFNLLSFHHLLYQSYHCILEVFVDADHILDGRFQKFGLAWGVFVHE